MDVKRTYRKGGSVEFHYHLKIFLFFLLVYKNILYADCIDSYVVKDKNQYSQCAVVFCVQDKIESKEVFVTRHYLKSLITESECLDFCTQYKKNLNKFNDSQCYETKQNSDMKCELEQLENSVNSNPGKTNTTYEYGVYRGKENKTEGLSAFDFLINNGYLRRSTRNLDLGGGQYNTVSAFTNLFGIKNLTFDPYHRDAKHNQFVLKQDDFDTVTSMSILNVIVDDITRLQHIQLAYDKLKPGGTAYFMVYEGDGSDIKSLLDYQMNCKAVFYEAAIKSIFHSKNEANEFESSFKNTVVVIPDKQFIIAHKL